MAKTLKATATALTANTGAFASVGLASAAEAAHVAKIIKLMADRPDLANPILRLIDDKNITEG